jgi:hypothetical protein
MDRLVRITTALTAVAVAVMAAIMAYQHGYELMRSYGESRRDGPSAPLTVDSLTWAASIVRLDTSGRHLPVRACPPGA